MFKDVDLFEFWRLLLTVVVSIYVLVYTARTMWGWLCWFNSSRQCKVVGRYTAVLLLRTRVRRFRAELIRIAALLAVLGLVVGLHWVLA